MAVTAEASSLVSGINGATVLSVYSSNLPGTFLIPRTVPATAVAFTEPELTPISRQSEYSTSHHQSCGRPILSLGAKLNTAQTKVSPILNIVSRITKPMSTLKSKIYQRVGLACLFPKLLRPYEPILKYVRCTLGLDDDGGYMEAPPCNYATCNETSLEEKVITRDRGFPDLEYMIRGQVSTMDDCFEDMRKVTYGSRVQAKLVDDQSCEDYQYHSICQEAMEQNLILLEEECQSPGYMLFNVICVYT